MIHPVMELEIFRFRERERREREREGERVVQVGGVGGVCVVLSQHFPGLLASLWLLMARSWSPPHGSSATTAADMREKRLQRQWQCDSASSTNKTC